jgi:hypothetical protein
MPATARRKDRVSNLWLLACQAVEKGGDFVRIIIAEGDSELSAPMIAKACRRSQA